MAVVDRPECLICPVRFSFRSSRAKNLRRLVYLLLQTAHLISPGQFAGFFVDLSLRYVGITFPSYSLPKPPVGQNRPQLSDERRLSAAYADRDAAAMVGTAALRRYFVMVRNAAPT
jgi:hypothetical protein